MESREAIQEGGKVKLVWLIIMEVLEEMHLKVQQALYKLEAGDLKKLCGGLPEIEDVDGKTKRQLIRRILNYLESSDVADTEDGGMAVPDWEDVKGKEGR